MSMVGDTYIKTTTPTKTVRLMHMVSLSILHLNSQDKCHMLGLPPSPSPVLSAYKLLRNLDTLQQQLGASFVPVVENLMLINLTTGTSKTMRFVCLT